MKPRRIPFGMTPPPKKRPKYGNRRTEVDGITFDSAKEARRWRQLRLLEGNGSIRDLKRQVAFVCEVNGLKVCTYKADFTYELRVANDWRGVVEDSKGMRTREYLLKKKLVRACHGIEIQES